MLQSLSAASILGADGLLNLDAALKLRIKIDKALKDFKPVVKYGKNRSKDYPIIAQVIVPVQAKKEANAVAKTLQADLKESISMVKVTGDKGKFVISFAATSQKEAKAAYEKLAATPGLVPTPSSYYVAPKRAKPIKYSAAKEKAGDVKYLKQRSVKVAQRRKLTDKVISILPVFEKGVLPQLEKEIKAAEAAIKKHITKSETVKGKVDKISAKNREQRQADYAELVTEVQGLFGTAIKPANIVIGQSMMGQTLYVKLPSNKVMTVGLSNMEAFNKAKKSGQ